MNSHEVRTPLNTVFMGLQLLSSSSLLKSENEFSKEFSEVLSCMNLSCEIAINTLNDLLLYDKIEDGNIILEKTPIFVEKFIKNCVKPFELQVFSPFPCFFDCFYLFIIDLNIF